MKKTLSKILVALFILLLIVAIYQFGLTKYLSLEYLKDNLNQFKNYYAQNQFLTIALFMGIYILTTALSIPGAAVLTLAAGALFGLWRGTIIVSFASTIGATLAFLAARFLLKDYVQEKFGNKLKSINDGVKREGAFYLFTLRLVPIFPFFIINLAMALTPIKTVTFFFVSQVGMLLGTIAYVNAGVQLGEISKLGDILSADLIVSFSVLGILPLVGKKIVDFLKARKVYRTLKKPKSYDYNMVVIGAGSAGLVTAYIGAAVNAKVALIEKHKMGGDCLNTGCVPSKAIIQSSKIVHAINNSQKYGIKEASCDFDFKEIMGRVHNVIGAIEPHDSVERYQKLGVDCLKGRATIKSPWEVEVDGKTVTTRHITIATGASPLVPSIEGLKDVTYLTSENLWQLEELPKKLAILGGGNIGMEMAQAFQRLGSQVTVFEKSGEVLSIEDEDVSQYTRKKLEDEGIKFLLNHNVVKVTKETIIAEHESKEVSVAYDQVLVALGRKANTKGFGLDEMGIKLRNNGTINTNEFLQTNYPNIYACGDVTGPYQLTHAASHQAWFCAVNSLFGLFKKFKVDYGVMPWATYTDPEVATVGKNEKRLQEEGIEYDITRYDIDDLDRAIADSSDYGFVKVLTKKGSDKILGTTIVAKNASDLILEYIAAMKHGFGMNDILGTIHPYPTMGEANKFAAGNWKKARKPEKILEWLMSFHKWRRKGTPPSKNLLHKTDA